MKGRLKVEYVATASLRPNQYNPNRQDDHAFRLLVGSMRDDGFTQPVIVGQDNVIVDGEHRWRAATELGLAEIPVVRVDMDDARRRIATIRHNEARGSHEADLVGAILADLDSWGALEGAMTALDMDRDEADRLMGLIDATAPELLASDEPGEAWVPAPVMAGDHNGMSQAVAQGAVVSTAAATPGGERRVVKLIYIVDEAEAAMIHQALGHEQPAVRLVELCRQAVAG